MNQPPLPGPPKRGPGERRPTDSACAKPRQKPFDWRLFSHQGISVKQDLTKMHSPSPLNLDLARAALELRLESAAAGKLTPNAQGPGRWEEPTVKPVESDQRLWELRCDLTRFDAGTWRIYHSEEWTNDHQLIALLAHEKRIHETDNERTRREQNMRISAAIERRNKLTAKNWAQRTICLDLDTLWDTP